MDGAKHCKTYWGSHGCDLPEGHADGPDATPHVCVSCAAFVRQTVAEAVADESYVGAPPYYGEGTKFFGDHANQKRDEAFIAADREQALASAYAACGVVVVES